LRLIIFFFTNQIIYRRRGARISGNPDIGVSYFLFPTSSPCFRPVYRALERLQLPGFREQITVPLRCENYSPPHPEIRAPTPGVVFLGGTRGWGFMKKKIPMRYGNYNYNPHGPRQYLARPLHKILAFCSGGPRQYFVYVRDVPFCL
jgi:hypothetical protein